MTEARCQRTWSGRLAIAGAAGVVILGVYASRDNLLFHISPASHYRKHRDADSLWAVLRFEVHNGDSVRRVEELLGPARRNENPRYRALCDRVINADPLTCPEGFEPDDELLGYKTGRLLIHLQARDGRLVNFNPNDYPIEFNTLGGG